MIWILAISSSTTRGNRNQWRKVPPCRLPELVTPHICKEKMPNNSVWWISTWIGLGIVKKIPIPIHWVRYLFLSDTFFNTNFMKSVLTRLYYLKNFGLICSACWHLYRLKASSPEPPHKGTQYIQNKSVQIVLIKFKVSVRLPLH